MRKKREYDPNDIYHPLPTRIRELREEKRLTQEELGRLIEVTKSNVGNYENSINTPPADKIVLLAKKLGVTSDYLLGLSDAKTNDVTETAICEYLNLDIDTVRTLHDSAEDKKLHIVIDFLFKEKELLQLITQYAWSILPKLIDLTRFRCLQYEVPPFLMKYEQESFSELIYHLQSFNESFFSLCKENLHGFDSIIAEFAASKIDVKKILGILAEKDPNMPVFRELFSSYDPRHLFEDVDLNTPIIQELLNSCDPQKLFEGNDPNMVFFLELYSSLSPEKLFEENGFRNCLNVSDNYRYMALIRPDRNKKQEKGKKEDKHIDNLGCMGEHFEESASEALRLRAKQRKIAESVPAQLRSPRDINSTDSK